MRAKKADKKLVTKKENGEAAKHFMRFQHWKSTQESRKISNVIALNVEVQYSFFV